MAAVRLTNMPMPTTSSRAPEAQARPARQGTHAATGCQLRAKSPERRLSTPRPAKPMAKRKWPRLITRMPGPPWVMAIVGGTAARHNGHLRQFRYDQ
jgi:hypothetical protein